MMDLTLTSELYNNLKFNMHKLILDVDDCDCRRLSNIFGADIEETERFLEEFTKSCREQALKLEKKITLPDIHETKTVAFVGDSITSDREGYLNILKEFFKNTSAIKFIDASVSGDKSDDAKMKFYFRALNYNPDIVHILLGTNDMRQNNDCDGQPCVSIQDFKKNLMYMIKRLKYSDKDIVISTLSPVDNRRLKKRFPDDNWVYQEGIIDMANEAIAEIADEFHIKLNDMRPVYKAFNPADILLNDGLHLNGQGQQLLAQNILKSIKEYL